MPVSSNGLNFSDLQKRSFILQLNRLFEGPLQKDLQRSPNVFFDPMFKFKLEAGGNLVHAYNVGNLGSCGQMLYQHVLILMVLPLLVFQNRPDKGRKIY